MLTYCGNVHPAHDVSAWLESVRTHSVPVADAWRKETGRPFGLGTWWNAAVAEELSNNPSALAEVRDMLLGHDLGLWTLNVFPFGAFHGEAVKTAVYRPDWLDEERLLYTRNVAEVTARLAPHVATPDRIALSTLPLGYRKDRQLDEESWRRMARNLVRAASHLAGLRERCGVHLVLCLEPEPCCLLETVAETAQFLEDWVFREGAWDTVGERALRDHLGVCVDLCHMAVVGEDALAAMQDLGRREIAVGKVQVSCCLETRDPADPVAFERLLQFDEPVYLHQTVGQSGVRALDLAEVRARRAEFAGGGRLRTHFHTPVFWDEDGPFGSTRAEMLRVLAGLREAVGDPLPLLEVETYTWDVLPAALHTASLSEGLLRELRFVAANLEKN